MQKNILIYLLSLAGGAGKNAVKYANNLVSAGFQVVVVCGITRAHGLEQQLDRAVELHQLGASRNLLAITGLARSIKGVAPSLALVVGPGNMAPFNIAALAAGYSGPVVLRMADSPSGALACRPLLLRWLKRWSFKYSFRRANKLIALTHALEVELEKDWSIPRDRISYIPNSIKLPEVTFAVPKADPPVILCVGRLERQKDHETLLKAFALVRESRPCQLQLAGDGRKRPQLKELAVALGVAPDVEFLGHVEDPSSLYMAASVTALSSRHEGFPNVLIEALAHGCPVVSTDCPTGPAEIITGDHIGLLAEPGDPDDLAEKLDTSIEQCYDPNLLRARAAEFSEEALRTRSLNLINSILNP